MDHVAFAVGALTLLGLSILLGAELRPFGFWRRRK